VWRSRSGTCAVIGPSATQPFQRSLAGVVLTLLGGAFPSGPASRRFLEEDFRLFPQGRPRHPAPGPIRSSISTRRVWNASAMAVAPVPGCTPPRAHPGGGASAVGLDMVFAEPDRTRSRPSPRNPADLGRGSTSRGFPREALDTIWSSRRPSPGGPSSWLSVRVRNGAGERGVSSTRSRGGLSGGGREGPTASSMPAGSSAPSRLATAAVPPAFFNVTRTRTESCAASPGDPPQGALYPTSPWPLPEARGGDASWNGSGRDRGAAS